MNILINGASVSTGEYSWPYLLQKNLNCNLVNLARPMCGATYIHETTIAELSERSYDLVLIMWADGINRIDYKLSPDSISTYFLNKKYTSLEQTKNYDWPEKIIYPVNDQEVSQKDWVFGAGYLDPRSRDDVNAELFSGYYKFTSHKEQLFYTLIRIISLQGVLKSMHVPYRFIFFTPLSGRSKFPKLFELIDFEMVYNGDSLKTIAVENNWMEGGKFDAHPNKLAQEMFATQLTNYIQNL